MKKNAQPLLFAAVLQPLQRFFQLEASSGILLLLSAAAALVWANSPWAAGYAQVFDYPLVLGAGEGVGRFTVRALVNDGLMAVFFFVVGMEIKRELVVGELRTLQRALLPLIAAVGGMAVPALAGIGFTVALFIGGLAFPEAARLDEAKLGILLGSLLSGVLGYALLRLSPGTRSAEAPGALPGEALRQP